MLYLHLPLTLLKVTNLALFGWTPFPSLGGFCGGWLLDFGFGFGSGLMLLSPELPG